MKKIETNDTVASFFMAALLLSFCISNLCAKLMGVLTGMGVPNTSN